MEEEHHREDSADLLRDLREDLEDLHLVADPAALPRDSAAAVVLEVRAPVPRPKTPMQESPICPLVQAVLLRGHQPADRRHGQQVDLPRDQPVDLHRGPSVVRQADQHRGPQVVPLADLQEAAGLETEAVVLAEVSLEDQDLAEAVEVGQVDQGLAAAAQDMAEAAVAE